MTHTCCLPSNVSGHSIRWRKCVALPQPLPPHPHRLARAEGTSMPCCYRHWSCFHTLVVHFLPCPSSELCPPSRHRYETNRQQTHMLPRPTRLRTRRWDARSDLGQASSRCVLKQQTTKPARQITVITDTKTATTLHRYDRSGARSRPARLQG